MTTSANYFEISKTLSFIYLFQVIQFKSQEEKRNT